MPTYCCDCVLSCAGGLLATSSLQFTLEIGFSLCFKVRMKLQNITEYLNNNNNNNNNTTTLITPSFNYYVNSSSTLKTNKHSFCVLQERTLH